MLQPDSDNANTGSLSGALREFMDSYMRGMEDMLPASVVSYDRDTNRAVIQPLVMLGTTDGGKVARARQVNIPVFRFGGGGFFISVPLQPGDFGWIKANDRDISLVMQRGGLEDWPNTKRIHSFSDAMFFPDKLKGWLIDGKNADALVIQSMDGSTCLALDVGRVEIDSTVFKINANVEIVGDVQVIGDTTATGSVDITGNVGVVGDISNDGDLINNGVDVGNKHTHDDTQPGDGISGIVTA